VRVKHQEVQLDRTDMSVMRVMMMSEFTLREQCRARRTVVIGTSQIAHQHGQIEMVGTCEM